MNIYVTGFNVQVNDKGEVSFWIESGDIDNPNTTCEISVEAIPLFVLALERARNEALKILGAEEK